MVATDVRPPRHEAERDTALPLTWARVPRARHSMLGADKGYDAERFVTEVRLVSATPQLHATSERRPPRH